MGILGKAVAQPWRNQNWTGSDGYHSSQSPNKAPAVGAAFKQAHKARHLVPFNPLSSIERRKEGLQLSGTWTTTIINSNSTTRPSRPVTRIHVQ